VAWSEESAVVVDAEQRLFRTVESRSAEVERLATDTQLVHTAGIPSAVSSALLPPCCRLEPNTAVGS
jgi:hypothetical protein